jgi:hypothetical protein
MAMRLGGGSLLRKTLTVAAKGTYEELEAYAARIAAGYRPPLHSNLPASITSVI